MNRVVALDVDGVLADFDGHWRQCAERVLGRCVPRVSISVEIRPPGHFYALINTSAQLENCW